MALADDLEQVRRREIAARLDAGERALTLPFELPKTELSEDLLARLAVFGKWCEAKSVRQCAAKPKTVAAFVLDQHALGASVQNILAMLEAIEVLHDSYHGLSNPTRAAVVRAALDQIVRADPPRSWPKEEKAEFARLPPDIRYIIAKREQERDRALRNGQNAIADKLKQLGQKEDKPNGLQEVLTGPSALEAAPPGPGH
jgi:hypothetical protein